MESNPPWPFQLSSYNAFQKFYATLSSVFASWLKNVGISINGIYRRDSERNILKRLLTRRFSNTWKRMFLTLSQFRCGPLELNAILDQLQTESMTSIAG